MNILITGSYGQLGRELQHLFDTGRAGIGSILPEYASATIHYTDSDVLDITDAEAVERFVTENGIDLIFNCAAYTNVDACETNRELAHAINALGPYHLALAAQKVKAALVHISTDYVFRGDDPTPRREEDSPDPQSAYGITKYEGERLVADSCDRHFIVRTAWLYSHYGKNFVKTILQLAHRQGHIQVVNDQIGNPTCANDLAFELLRIAQTSDYGIYHCTSNGFCSWFDFACAIVDETGINCTREPCATNELLRPAKRPAFSILDNARLRATINDDMRPWDLALKGYFEDSRFDLEEVLKEVSSS